MTQIENQFHNDMIHIYLTAKKELHYNATRFIQMVTEMGGIKAAKMLISKKDESSGFSVLWENGALDLTVERLVLVPQYGELFCYDEKLRCFNRLVECGYPEDQLKQDFDPDLTKLVQ